MKRGPKLKKFANLLVRAEKHAYRLKAESTLSPPPQLMSASPSNRSPTPLGSLKRQINVSSTHARSCLYNSTSIGELCQVAKDDEIV